MAGFADFGIYLGNTLGVGEFAGGLLASMLFTVFFCLLPVLLFTKGRSMVAEMIAGILGMSFSIAVGWISYFFIVLIILIVALMFTGSVRDFFSGRGGRG